MKQTPATILRPDDGSPTYLERVAADAIRLADVLPHLIVGDMPDGWDNETLGFPPDLTGDEALIRRLCRWGGEMSASAAILAGHANRAAQTGLVW